MSMFIQNNLIRWILQPLAAVSDRISQKVKNFLFVLCGSGIFFLNIFNNTEAVNLRYLYVFAFSCLMIGLMLLCTLPKKITPVKFDKKLLFPWLGFTAFMLIAGFTKSVDYLADTMLFLVMFPVLFLVWNNCNFSHVIKLLSCTARVVAIVLFSICILFFPVTGSKYAGCFSNVNGFSIFLCSLFVLLFVSFLIGKRSRVWRWVDLLLAGICWALIYYSNSRTGQLACLMVAACTLLLLLILEKKRLSSLLWDVFPVVLVLFISAQVVLPVFVGIHRITAPFQNAIISIFNNKDSSDTGTEPDASTPPDVSAEDILHDIQNIQNIKTETNGKTLNQFATGRVEIWKGTLDHITFWGHAVDETFTFDYRGEIGEHSTAHMTILDFAYDYGLLAGVFYLLFNLIAGVKSIGFTFRQPKERWMLAPFAISIAYGCISLLATTSEVYGYMIALLYYLLQAPLMIAKKKD